MFDRKAWLTTDIIFQRKGDPPCVTHKAYLEDWKETMKDAYAVALQNAGKNMRKKENYHQGNVLTN